MSQESQAIAWQMVMFKLERWHSNVFNSTDSIDRLLNKRWQTSQLAGCRLSEALRCFIHKEEWKQFCGVNRSTKRSIRGNGQPKASSICTSIWWGLGQVEEEPALWKSYGWCVEQQIHSACFIAQSLMETHVRCLDEESLVTLITGTDAILNLWPLATDNFSDSTSSLPLSSLNLLIMKSKVIMSQPSNFFIPDVYSGWRWRQIQHVAKENLLPIQKINK